MILLKQTKRIFLIAAGCLLWHSLGQAAIEATYTETDTEMSRDESGAQLNPYQDVYRNVPDNRKMKKIVGNVVKAEERDEYTYRIVEELRQEMTNRFQQMNKRVATLEGQVYAMKTLLSQSDVVKKRKQALAQTQASTSTATETEPTTTII